MFIRLTITMTVLIGLVAGSVRGQGLPSAAARPAEGRREPDAPADGGRLPPLPAYMRDEATNDPEVSPAAVTVLEEVTPNAKMVAELRSYVTPSGKILTKPELRNPSEPPLLNRFLGLEDSPFRVFGWIQNSYTANPSQPSDGMNFGVNPNYRSNQWMGNQYYLAIEDPVEQDDQVNFGYRLDTLLGHDWQFSHATGLFDGAWPQNYFAGIDLPQMYGEAHLPILTPGGLDLRFGRWYSIAGYESVPAISRPLLSVPYMFNYGQPFTFTGFLANLHLTDRVMLYNGVVNGWDRWFDESLMPNYIGAINWESKSGKTGLAVTMVYGPEQFPYFFKPSNQRPPTGVPPPPYRAGQRNYRYKQSDTLLFTTVLSQKWTKKLTQVVETDEAVERDVPGIGRGGQYGTASWYGLANWFLYALDAQDKVTLVWRSEVFRDDSGIRTAAFSGGRSGGGARFGYRDNFYEMTLGAILKPVPFIWVRPEARYDWAQNTRPYNGGHSSSQFTLAFDVLFLF